MGIVSEQRGFPRVLASSGGVTAETQEAMKA